MDFKYKNINSIKGFGNDILLNILKARGIEDTNLFLNLNDKVLEDYKNYDNMDIAGKTYLNHINSENKIGIVIDFDCDGFTSASEMFLYTKEVCNKLNKNFNTEYIMHDHKSHGLDESIMKTIKEGQYNLLLIPDAGTNDYKQHKELKDLNMDIICLDHHQSKKYSNDAIIVNNQMSSKIKNKAMTGVGVVYKFCKYIDELLKFNIADDYLDIVALSSAIVRPNVERTTAPWIEIPAWGAGWSSAEHAGHQIKVYARGRGGHIEINHPAVNDVGLCGRRDGKGGTRGRSTGCQTGVNAIQKSI